jgi:proton glutamate symport protein
MTTSRRAVLLTLIALVLGMVLGAAVSSLAAAERLVAWIEPVGLIWVNAIRMTVIPLIVSALIVAVAGAEPRTLGRLGARTIAVFLFLLAILATLTTLLAPWLFGFMQIDATAVAAVRQGITAETAIPTLPSFSSWLVGLVPSNPVAAAADGAMLPLVIFTVAFSLALGRISAGQREPVIHFFRAASEAMTILVGWILLAAPLGAFALTFAVAARTGTELVGAAGFYIVAYSGLLILGIAAVYLVIALFSRVPVRLFARAALPAQLVAITTRSSMAALPANVASAEEILKLPRTTTSLVLPLAVSSFRLNQAVSWVVMAIFAAALYGVELSMMTLVTLAITSVFMSFSVPGIPSASLFVVAPFFVDIGIPAEAIGVLIALDLIPDVFKTTLNVTGHLAAVALVAKEGGG